MYENAPTNREHDVAVTISRHCHFELPVAADCRRYGVHSSSACVAIGLAVLIVELRRGVHPRREAVGHRPFRAQRRHPPAGGGREGGPAGALWRQRHPLQRRAERADPGGSLQADILRPGAAHRLHRADEAVQPGVYADIEGGEDHLRFGRRGADRRRANRRGRAVPDAGSEVLGIVIHISFTR